MRAKPCQRQESVLVGLTRSLAGRTDDALPQRPHGQTSTAIRYRGTNARLGNTALVAKMRIDDRRKPGTKCRPHRAAFHLGAPLAAVLSSMLLIMSMPVSAAPAPGGNPSGGSDDARPYDAKLLRLAELLGSIHYLRELCGANEGQFWRDTMQELMKSEGFTAGRQARLTASFNQGYRSYSRTYNVCTPTARAAIDRFLAEGADIADALVRTTP